MIPFDSNLFIDTARDKFDFRGFYFSEGEISAYANELRGNHYALQDRYNDFRRKREETRSAFKSKLRMQMLSQNNSRYGMLSGGSIQQVRSYLLEFAAALKDEEFEACVDLLNTIADYSNSLAERCFEHLNSSTFCDEVVCCSNCNAYVPSDWVQQLALNDGVICQSCCDDRYTHSECMDGYIHVDDAISVYGSIRGYRNGNPVDRCTRSYANRNFYESTSVEEFFTNEEDAAELDGDDEDSDELQDWHQTYRNFEEVNETGNYPALGLELEIYCEERGELVRDLRDNFSGQLILERDGSIDEYHGFEIISQPFGREEWDELLPSMIRVIQDQGGIGYNEPAGDCYGIHLSIHRRHLSPLAEARIAMFLVDEANGQFVRAVAQRNQIYSHRSGVGIGVVNQPRLTIVSPDGLYNCYDQNGGSSHRRKMQGRGKYCPVNFKESIAEFRIFQSTTNMKSIQKNLEFVWALHKWTLPETASGSSHSYVDFLTWLNQPQQRNEFPELIAFLSKRMFYGTNFTPFLSPWKSLMTKPVESDACESLAA